MRKISCLYVIENGNRIYVGSTRHWVARRRTHLEGRVQCRLYGVPVLEPRMLVKLDPSLTCDEIYDLEGKLMLAYQKAGKTITNERIPDPYNSRRNERARIKMNRLYRENPEFREKAKERSRQRHRKSP